MSAVPVYLLPQRSSVTALRLYLRLLREPKYFEQIPVKHTKQIPVICQHGIYEINVGRAEGLRLASMHDASFARTWVLTESGEVISHQAQV